jgi:2-desacetyl-2-hydroxyethyl bacteriochlorophyllide A dehydrogenase
MRALTCIEPGRLLLEERPEPQRSESEVLVAVRRVGICGTDYHIFQGTHPYLQYPRVMGHELAVEVVEAGPSGGLRPGMLCVVNPYLSCGHCVACRKGKPNCCVTIQVLGVHRDGGMTEYLCLPASNLLPADDLSADQSAAVEFLAIGAHAVKRAAVGPGDKVLVVGAGPIGLGVISFARIAGAEVAVLDMDLGRCNSARELTGATVLPTQDVAAAMRDHTNGDLFDVVIDATGNAAAMHKGFGYVAHGGRYVLVSVVRDSITFMDPEFHRTEMTLLASRNALAADFLQVMASIRGGAIDVSRFITQRTSLDRADAAIATWAADKTGLIKGLIEVA